LKKTAQKGILIIIKKKKIEILDWKNDFLNAIFSVEFRMKYFKDIEILYEKKILLFLNIVQYQMVM